MAQVALAWLRSRSVIPILGARKLTQLQDNLGQHRSVPLRRATADAQRCQLNRTGFSTQFVRKRILTCDSLWRHARSHHGIGGKQWAWLRRRTRMKASNFQLDKEFAGKRVLVTGGTRGVGEAIVRRLASAGGIVATTARSPRPAGLDVRLFVQADISTRKGADKIISKVLDRFGGIDILIPRAGGSSDAGGGTLVLSDADWQEAFEMNLFAATRLDRGFLPSMLKQGSGVIIHVSSIQRTLPLFDSTLAYAAAKAAL